MILSKFNHIQSYLTIIVYLTKKCSTDFCLSIQILCGLMASSRMCLLGYDNIHVDEALVVSDDSTLIPPLQYTSNGYMLREP
jgi:hypothetical protein